MESQFEQIRTSVAIAIIECAVTHRGAEMRILPEIEQPVLIHIVAGKAKDMNSSLFTGYRAIPNGANRDRRALDSHWRSEATIRPGNRIPQHSHGECRTGAGQIVHIRQTGNVGSRVFIMTPHHHMRAVDTYGITKAKV